MTFMTELLSTVSDGGRRLVGLTPRRRPEVTRRDIMQLCADLLSHRGEASGVAIAQEILARYGRMTRDEKNVFLTGLADQFGPDEARLAAAIADWQRLPSPKTIAEIHEAAEPRRQELARRLNLAPGGTAALVKLREDVLDLAAEQQDLRVLDADIGHLFNSWFNRGFLVVKRIDWTTPANILEKIIRYEAVHTIAGWEDLRLRLEPEDRRCYAFFHPQLADDPLIFVEIALTELMPRAIQPLLQPHRTTLPLRRATTAVFYSISNCHKGLAGVSFGSFLIKQVVDELKRELPDLTTFVTLSPAPGFSRWLQRETASPTGALSAADVDLIVQLDDPDWADNPALVAAAEPVILKQAARYFLDAKTANGRPVDSVARFHVGNGARLERLNFLGDRSKRGLAQAYGLMVNYLYDLAGIEENHEAYAETGAIRAHADIVKLARREDLRPVKVG
jgi:malonyl-CoA decarboxylase